MLRLDSLRDLQQLRHVTLRGGPFEPLRARQCLEQELARVDWNLTQLPPHALLLVRRLTLPRRGGSTLGAQMSQALRQQAQDARRPWLQADAVSASAVWFASADELAACLVRDWLHDTVREHWWWPAILAGASVTSWLRDQVLDRGERVVAVIWQLASHGQAVGWLRRLEDGDARRAAQSIAHAYALPADGANASLPPTTSPLIAPGSATASRHGSRPAPPAPLARLQRVLPELRDAGLKPAAARALAWALVAMREPAWLRTPAFAQALSSWITMGLPAGMVQATPHARAAWHTDREPTPQPLQGSAALAGPPASANGLPDDMAGGARKQATPAPIRRRTLPDALPPQPGALPVTPSPAAAPGAKHRARNPAPSDPSPLPPGSAAVAQTGTTPQQTKVQAGPAPGLAVPATTSSLPGYAQPEAWPPQPVHTAFGGIFYLLNAALALGLYGDFTAPRAPGLALSPWDWLALTGQDWLGRDFVDDPIWPLLAVLAGRHGQAPGAGFAAPPDWTLPHDWLLPWGKAARLEYRATRNRLRILHPAGFIVFDVARDERPPATHAAALCLQYAALRQAVLRRAGKIAPPGGPRSPTARWLAGLQGYLLARLAVSLNTGLARNELASYLCRCPGRIVRSANTVDVHLSLATLPLPIRVAGLDRDPGWIPAAGLSVYFHYD